MCWVNDYNNQQPRNIITISLVRLTKYQILVYNWVQNGHMIMNVSPTQVDAYFKRLMLSRGNYRLFTLR